MPAPTTPGAMNAASNAHEFTVSELSGTLKRTVEDQFGHVRVRGELSGVKRAASGHLYLALKDENAVLDGVCWRGNASRLSFRPEDGLEVICTGKLTTYPGRSKYQIVIDRMEPAGAGALMALLEERKRQLAAEGLFASDRKQAIPFLPRTIGVVTSPTGSVIRDILHRLADRFPRRVLVWPVMVQGDGAAEQVARAIRGFNRFDGTNDLPRPDVLIVARGGGSIEDLWSFNEEVVVRAAAESRIPLISAVGHETDTTLIDHAADRRAPTPTGAAEMAVPVRADLLATVADYGRRLAGMRARLIDDRRERVSSLARALPTPRDIMGLKAQKLDDLADRLPRGLTSLLKDRSARLHQVAGGLRPGSLRDRARLSEVRLGELADRLPRGLGMLVQDRTARLAKVASGLRASTLKDKAQLGAERLDARASRMEPAYRRSLERLSGQLEAASRMLESLSYQRVLDRGFALVSDAAGQPVTKGATLGQGAALSLQFADGTRGVRVDDQVLSGGGEASGDTAHKAAPRKARSSKPVKPAKTPDGQGQLF